LAYDQLFIGKLSHDRAHMNAERAGSNEATMAVGVLVAPLMLGSRPNEDWNLLAVVADL
jgi:hypothetical protein